MPLLQRGDNLNKSIKENSIFKVYCPNCDSVCWNFEIMEYNIEGEDKLICPHCPIDD